MKLPTCLHLLKHVLENHFNDQREIKEDNSKDDDILNYEAFSYDTEGEYEKDSGFVFKSPRWMNSCEQEVSGSYKNAKGLDL